MRVGVIIRSYKLTEYLERVIMNYSWVDRIIVPNCTFDRSFNTQDDNTQSIIAGLPQDIAKKVVTFFGCYPQSEVFDRAQNMLTDMDVIFISDADEFILQSDQMKIAAALLLDNTKVVICDVIDYKQKTPVDGKLEAFAQRTHRPIVAVKYPAHFTGTRHAEGDTKYIHVSMHHFGYAIDGQVWKRDNLWYPQQSYDKVVCTQVRTLNVPEELHNALTIKSSS